MRSPKKQLQALARGWSSGRPAVSIILIAANVGCYAAQAIVASLTKDWDAAPNLLGLSHDAVFHGHLWQLVTYMFLHQGPMHLLANMLAFYFAGREIEAILGPRHLLGIYFGGGIVGGMAYLASGSSFPLIGASAGVCATIIAFTTILPEMELTIWLFFVVPVRLKAKHFAIILVSIMAGLQIFEPHLGRNVSELAHLGGCFLGWLYIKQLGYGNPLRIQRYFFARRQRAERYARMSPAQFISQEIDPILDKISREGIHSLSRAEKKVLEKGREKIARKITPRV